MEHIEEAGIHSGDSACALPPHSLPRATVDEITRQAVMLAEALGVVGLMNVQFAVKDGTVYILEVNPRASRTVPFVAKATGMPIAKIAARVMAGAKLSEFELRDLKGAFQLLTGTVLSGANIAITFRATFTLNLKGVAAAIPEPGTFALLGGGILVFAAAAARRRS